MAVSVTRRLKDEIENGIVEGRYLPGDRLDEATLADRYGVSRTPVREALHALAASGLIEVRPHRGAIVAEVGPHQLVEMFEVMAELEAMCGRLAARRATEADHLALRTAHVVSTRAAEAGDLDGYYYDNERFHSAIYDASHNDFLAEQARALARRLQPYRRLQLRVRNRLATSFREHGEIVDAIVAGDEELAARRLRGHVVVQGERFADLIASMRTLHQAVG